MSPKITGTAHTKSYDTGIPTVGTRTRAQKQTSTCETISPSPSTASTIDPSSRLAMRQRLHHDANRVHTRRHLRVSSHPSRPSSSRVRALSLSHIRAHTPHVAPISTPSRRRAAACSLSSLSWVCRRLSPAFALPPCLCHAAHHGCLTFHLLLSWWALPPPSSSSSSSLF